MAAYDAFGNVRSGKLNSLFGYAGEYTDAESGLIYLRARYYDPAMGRFVSEDPVKDGTNWYAYCHNDPVNFVDPGGMAEVWIRDWFKSRGGLVTPNQYGFWPIYWGLKSITVSLLGQKPVTYTSADYTIKNNLAYIDDSILNRDFRTDGVYAALIAGAQQLGTNGSKARQWMASIDSTFNATTGNYCMTFVSWVLAEAGLPSPKAQYAGNGITWYNNKGKYRLTSEGYTPNVGDTIFMGIYEEKDGNGKVLREVEGAYHAAIVIAFVPPDTVYTIEGGGASSNVKIAKRSLSDQRRASKIYGIGRNGGEGNGYVPDGYDIKVP